MKTRRMFYIFCPILSVLFSLNCFGTYQAIPETITPRVKASSCGKTVKVRPKEQINECPLVIAVGETVNFANDGSFDKDTCLDGTQYLPNDTMKAISWSLTAGGQNYQGSGSLNHTFDTIGGYTTLAKVDDLYAIADDDEEQIEVSVDVKRVDYVIVCPNPANLAIGQQKIFEGKAYNYGTDGLPYYNEQGGIIDLGRPNDDILLAATFDWHLVYPNEGTVSPEEGSATSTFTPALDANDGNRIYATYNKNGQNVEGSALIKIIRVDYIIVLPNPGICAPNQTIEFSAKAYSNGINGNRELDDKGVPYYISPPADDIEISASFDWTLSPEASFGTIDPISDTTYSTFTAGLTIGTGTITATYNKQGEGNNVSSSANINVNSIVIDLMEFGINGQNEHALKKCSSGDFFYDLCEPVGEIAIADPIWISGRSFVDPVSFTRNSIPKLISAKLKLEEPIQDPINAKIRISFDSHVYTAGPLTPIVFFGNITLDGQDVEIAEITTQTALNNFMTCGAYKHKWEISYDNGVSWQLIHDSLSDSHDVIHVFLTYDNITAGSYTSKRMQVVTSFGNSTNDLNQIVESWGSFSTPRFNVNNNWMYSHNPWRILDGDYTYYADCITTCALMKDGLELMGAITNSELRYVYACHEDWSHIWSYSQNDNETHPSTSDELGIWMHFGENGQDSCYNNWEGCLYIPGDNFRQWWMGGTGVYKNSAYDVLTFCANPNENGSGPSSTWPNHQCWWSNTESEMATAVPYPGGTIIVPDLSGMTMTLALDEIENANLNIGEIYEEHDNNILQGLICDQDPNEGTEVAAGTLINVTVSLGPEE